MKKSEKRFATAWVGGFLIFFVSMLFTTPGTTIARVLGSFALIDLVGVPIIYIFACNRKYFTQEMPHDFWTWLNEDDLDPKEKKNEKG